jgi:succinate dehydrogenase hydrophobic anchor subunit
VITDFSQTITPHFVISQDVGLSAARHNTIGALFALLIVAVIVLFLIRFAKKRIGVSPSSIVEIIQQITEIVFPALIAILLALHIQNGVVYVETAEVVTGIVLGAVHAILNAILQFIPNRK